MPKILILQLVFAKMIMKTFIAIQRLQRAIDFQRKKQKMLSWKVKKKRQRELQHPVFYQSKMPKILILLLVIARQIQRLQTANSVFYQSLIQKDPDHPHQQQHQRCIQASTALQLQIQQQKQHNGSYMKNSTALQKNLALQQISSMKHHRRHSHHRHRQQQQQQHHRRAIL